MIRRKTATAFLFFAGILFLAHAVVPHHHHGNLICFVKSHCEGENPSGNHGSSPDNHHHDNDGCDDNCVLKDPVIVSSNQPGNGNKLHDKEISHPGIDNLINGLQVTESGSPAGGLWHSLSAPPTIFTYSCISLPCSGLRAPPQV